LSRKLGCGSRSVRSLQEPLDLRQQGSKGLAAVAEAVFVLRREFGCGASQSGHEEMRVVAEAVSASRLVDDAAGDGAFGAGQDAVGCCQYGGAAEVCRPLVVRDASQGGDELGVVFGIGAVGSGIAC
jgi:hypothetical protein